MINERVTNKYKEVRAISQEGHQIGVLDSRKALDEARKEGLDLVLISEKAVPPVCKIIDYGRYKYELKKQEKEHKKVELPTKEVKISPNIADHDLTMMINRAIKFLTLGHKVRITCVFKSREIQYPENGHNKMNRVTEKLDEIGIMEKQPFMENKNLFMIYAPK